MSTVITVENLGKKYTISHQQREEYSSLRDVITNGVRSLSKNFFSPFTPHTSPIPASEDFWALKDASFEVKQGDRIGIIGRNGAGKSTLLKILSRITEPTTGCIRIKGRVASLLEVGTGFHPELTGRENIFLNGAILGMQREEIRRKFDEIVDFSEIEKFLDTPVKRYSSGMYVRLAFAVAAYLEPEILIIDEVLAVGDAAFQKKCLGKMGDVAKEGRTVLFVSHNMAAIQNLCNRGIVLHNGCVQMIGTHLESVTAYLASLGANRASFESREDRRGTGEVRVESIEFVDRYGREVEATACGQYIGIRMYFSRTGTSPLPHIIAGLIVKNEMDVPVFLHHSRLTRHTFGPMPERGYFELSIDKLPLPPAKYRVGYSLMQHDSYIDGISDAVELTVNGGDFYGSGEVPPITHGVCLVEGRWTMNPLSENVLVKEAI
jgi:lipopolysaccharide transport system ATP-binding protein